MIKIDKYNENLKKIYLNSRERLIKIIADSDTTQFKKQYSNTLLKQINKELRQLRKNSNDWISLVCPKEYQKGVRLTNKFFKDNSIDFSIDSTFATIHQDAVNILAREMSHNISQGIAQVGRKIETYFDGSDDLIRQIGVEASAEGLLTGQSNIDVKNEILKRLQENRFLNIKYANGREVPLDVYSLMCANSVRREATNLGTINQLTENGYDLVKISEHYPTCNICAMYQGRVFSISGKDKRFPRLDIPFNSGYFNIHPNCRHSVTPYMAELMTPEELEKDIENSNNLEDTRSAKEKSLYNEQQSNNRQARADLYQFGRYKITLGENAPKSYSAFRRVKNANSDKWQALQKAYRKTRRLNKDSNLEAVFATYEV